MGFDIYGMQPSGEQKPDVNWYDEPTVKAYFAWQKNTKGAYFRSNVWGWPGMVTLGNLLAVSVHSDSAKRVASWAPEGRAS